MLHLLKASIDHSKNHSTAALCEMKAAAPLSSEQVLQLLMAMAVRGGKQERSAVIQLCSLPAAAQLSTEQVYSVLEAAVNSGSWECIQACRSFLPAAAQLSSDEVAQLLEAACHCHSVRSAAQHGPHYWCIRELCELRAVANLSEHQLMHALKTIDTASTGSRTISGTGTLSNLPAAVPLSTKQVLPLLLTAAHGGDRGVVALLCKLPAAAQLSSKELVEVVRAAADGGCARWKAAVAELPASTEDSHQQMQRPLQLWHADRTLHNSVLLVVA
jgi:hypothetical protein